MKHYTKNAQKNQWILTASVDGIGVDYETIIESEKEPDFWTCYELAIGRGCEFFHVEPLEIVKGVAL